MHSVTTTKREETAVLSRLVSVVVSKSNKIYENVKKNAMQYIK